MARTTHVRKAQQRYETVVVLDDEGNPVRTPVMKTVRVHSDATASPEIRQVQKTTKKGKPVFMTKTVADKTKPLPPETCTACQKTIEVGTPYKWIQPKSGPYGGRRMARHEGCPSWQVWDYSSSLSAQLARISHDFNEAVDSAESPDDVQSALDEAAASVEEIVEQKREAASNIEEGFGHATSSSEQLEEIADQLESWASEISGADIPDLPEPDDRYFIEGPDGSRHGDDDGYETEDDARIALTGMLEDLIEEGSDITEDDFEFVAETPDEPSAEQIDEWRDAVRDAVTIVDESPV